jgi:hypothetical protein
MGTAAKNKGGRPTKLTDKTQARICGLLRKGLPRERAARLAGVHPRTFYVWMASEAPRYVQFQQAVCMAEDDLVEKAVGAVSDLIEDADSDAVRLNAAKFLLSHRFNSEFSTRQEVTGKDGAAVEVKAEVRAEVAVRPLFSDEQLAAMSPEQLTAALAGMAGRREA